MLSTCMRSVCDCPTVTLLCRQRLVCGTSPAGRIGLKTLPAATPVPNGRQTRQDHGDVSASHLQCTTVTFGASSDAGERGRLYRAGEGNVSDQPPWSPSDQEDPGQWQGQPPYQGQPYQGQPDQGQPPYGPPADQPPYPGPGYSSPRQPQGNQPGRNSHWLRNILAGIGAIVVVSFVVSHLSSGGGGVSTTASGNSGTANASASAALPPPESGHTSMSRTPSVTPTG